MCYVYSITCLFTGFFNKILGFCFENIFTINAVCLGFVVLEIVFPVIITSHIPWGWEFNSSNSNSKSAELIAAVAIIFGLLEIYGTVKKNFIVMIISLVYRCIRLVGFCLLLTKDWLANWTDNLYPILVSFVVWDSIKIIIILVTIHRIRIMNERNGYQYQSINA